MFIHGHPNDGRLWEFKGREVSEVLVWHMADQAQSCLCVMVCLTSRLITWSWCASFCISYLFASLFVGLLLFVRSLVSRVWLVCVHLYRRKCWCALVYFASSRTMFFFLHSPFIKPLTNHCWTIKVTHVLYLWTTLSPVKMETSLYLPLQVCKASLASVIVGNLRLEDKITIIVDYQMQL